ncbi:hypothetical protein B0T25DRAFT_223009 [Lasiosphaeria hispida]|uniref:Uncharacterized protein n=1 Tax=Lasiosphaeria hispida TaxID=260671 RepID=A0AAJ0HK95_9PEZI|nr:hypothetical protein B0T25DRAFT_223009 [Lasiosphaeria hispida]
MSRTEQTEFANGRPTRRRQLQVVTEGGLLLVGGAAGARAAGAAGARVTAHSECRLGGLLGCERGGNLFAGLYRCVGSLQGAESHQASRGVAGEGAIYFPAPSGAKPFCAPAEPFPLTPPSLSPPPGRLRHSSLMICSVPPPRTPPYGGEGGPTEQANGRGRLRSI